jgi:hypothetical protein
MTMAFTEQSRIRYFVKTNTGVRDSGMELVQYDGHAEGWEPVDTIFARGANGPTKVITGIRIIPEHEIGAAPLNSNVFYPRTGTAG